MVRGPLLALALASCGRVGFDGAAAIVDAGTDAAAVLDCSVLPDGSSCDDRDVCTMASTCQAGVCTGTGRGSGGASCMLAQSEDDFVSGEQGVNGWWYGFWSAGGDGSYEPATDFAVGVWDVDTFVPSSTSGPFLYIAWWGTHPDAMPLTFTVRRWISAVSGPAVAMVDVRNTDSCGDGVDARLVVGGVTSWSQIVAFADGVVSVPVPVELEIGRPVELLIGPVGSDSCDTTETTLTIRSP